MSSSAADVLDFRIPARMRELAAFVALGEALESAAGGKSIIVDIDGRRFSVSDHRFLLEPLADAAAVISRGLLNFLGLSSQAGSLVERLPSRPDDLRITDLGLSPLTIQAATSGWPASNVAPADLLLRCFLCADKVSAHLTANSAAAKNLDISSLVASFRFVNELINREVYDKLNRPVVTFASSSPFGCIEELPTSS